MGSIVKETIKTTGAACVTNLFASVASDSRTRNTTPAFRKDLSRPLMGILRVLRVHAESHRRVSV